MRKSISAWKISALSFLLTIPWLTAGVVFQVETTYHSGSGARTESSQMSVDRPNMKMEILPGKGSADGARDEVVFRGDRREMVVVNHRDKAYMVIDEQAVQRMGGQMQQMGGQMQQMQKELEKRLADLDPKQREMMEKMLKGRLGSMAGGNAPKPPQSEFKQSGERATKNGYPCVRYDVLRDGEKIRELWVTDWDNIKGGRDVMDAFKEMASFYGGLMDSFGQKAGSSGGFFRVDSNPVESFTKVDGFPVVTRNFEGGELESETVLESVTDRDLDPDAFEPPKGYRLRTMGPQ